MTEPFVVHADEGRHLMLGNFEAVVIADGDQTQGAFSVLRTQQEPPGFGPPLHVHHDAAEAFYVLDGEYQMFVPSGDYRCGPGAFVYVPTDVPHTFKVVSEEPGRKLNIFAPGAMVGFFEALAAAEAAGEVTPEMLDTFAAANHMEVVGPVPDSYL